MDQNNQCVKCETLMSFLGNNPSPVLLKCNHKVCLTCVNTAGEWLPQQPEKEFDYQCPVQECGISQKIDLNFINMQDNITRQNFQQQIGNIAAQNQILLKCKIHNNMPISFKCEICRIFICSICIIEHQRLKSCDKFQNISKNQIIQESNNLIELSKAAIQKHTQNIQMLEKISQQQDQIFSDEIQDIFMTATKSLTGCITDDKQKIADIKEKYFEIEFDSKIFVSKFDRLIFLSYFKSNIKLQLLMRGSDDGFQGQTFIDKCKNKGETITIIKDVEGKIFGAYTDLNFNGSGSWVSGCKNTFLFAFLDNKLIKCKCIKEGDEVCTSNDWFLSFGHGSLRIVPDCNVNSYSFGKELGEYFEKSTLPYQYLAGQRYFQIEELEIFQILQ